jgi:hypothetical protein
MVLKEVPPVHLLLCAIVFLPPDKDVSPADLARFPPQAEVLAAVERFKQEIEAIKRVRGPLNERMAARRPARGSPEWEEVAKELRALFVRDMALRRAQGCWMHVLHAQNFPADRITYLRQLREALGSVNYRRGRLPPPPAGP